MKYTEKLRDPRWQKKRLEVFSRDNFTCVCCGDKETELQVHHLSYVYGRHPWEYKLKNLQTFCKHCHGALSLFDCPEGYKISRIKKVVHGSSVAIFCRYYPLDHKKRLLVGVFSFTNGEFKFDCLVDSDELRVIDELLNPIQNGKSVL